MEVLKRFWKDERGLETVEWAVIAALIVTGLILTVKSLGGKVKQAFVDLDAAVTPTP